MYVTLTASEPPTQLSLHISPFIQKNRLSDALRYSNWNVRFENLSMFCTVRVTSGQVMLKMVSTRAPSSCVSGTCFIRPTPVWRITNRLEMRTHRCQDIHTYVEYLPNNESYKSSYFTSNCSENLTVMFD